MYKIVTATFRVEAGTLEDALKLLERVEKIQVKTPALFPVALRIPATQNWKSSASNFPLCQQWKKEVGARFRMTDEEVVKYGPDREAACKARLASLNKAKK